MIEISEYLKSPDPIGDTTPNSGAFSEIIASEGSVVFVASTSPGTPSAGMVYLYCAQDGLFYYKGSDGIEHLVGTGASSSDGGYPKWFILPDETVTVGDREEYAIVSGLFINQGTLELGDGATLVVL